MYIYIHIYVYVYIKGPQPPLSAPLSLAHTWVEQFYQAPLICLYVCMCACVHLHVNMYMCVCIRMCMWLGTAGPTWGVIFEAQSSNVSFATFW